MRAFQKLFLFSLLIFLSLACSRTRAVQSLYTPSPITVNGQIDDWPRDRMQIENNPEYDMYFANDDEFLYMYLIIKSPQILADIQRFGLHLYFDKERRNRRQFGFLYPIGLMNGLRDIPGARQEYLENPGWANFPENRRLMESIQQDMPNRVMLLQPATRRSQPRPVPVNMSALNAQDVVFKMDSEARLMNIEMKIPLQSTRSRQVALDVRPGSEVYVGFEISPPTPEDMGIDDRDRGTASQGRAPGMASERRNPNMRHAPMHMRGEFSRWVRVTLGEDR